MGFFPKICPKCDRPKDFDDSIHTCVLVGNRHVFIDSKFLSVVMGKKWIADKTYFVHSPWTEERIIFHKFVMDEVRSIRGVVDHINRNKMDNRLCNLRIVSYSANNQNQNRKISSVGFKGVTLRRKKFYASITFNKNLYYLGSFDTAEDAARAYDLKAVEFHGAIANTNFNISNYEIPERPKNLEINFTPPLRKSKRPICSWEDCDEFAKGREGYCNRHRGPYLRRVQAQADGRIVKEYKRVSQKSEFCTHDECKNLMSEIFARNMCQRHYYRLRVSEGIRRVSKKPRCQKQGCMKLTSGPKEDHLCRKHYNEKHGIIKKRTGRPVTKRVPCVLCGGEGATEGKGGMCVKCYTERWRRENIGPRKRAAPVSFKSDVCVFKYNEQSCGRLPEDGKRNMCRLHFDMMRAVEKKILSLEEVLGAGVDSKGKLKAYLSKVQSV